MSLKEKLIRQFAKPEGIGGYFVGWLMSISNRNLSNWAIEKLKPSNGESILEVGYGPGNTFEKVAAKLGKGMLAGIDHSQLMYRTAKKRNQKFLRTGCIILECGSVDSLNYPKHSFDKIYGINVHFFWEEPEWEFAKLKSYLKFGGKLLIVFQPRWAKSENEIKEIAENTRRQFIEAGFLKIRIELKSMKPVTAIAIVGINLKVSKRKDGKRGQEEVNFYPY